MPSVAEKLDGKNNKTRIKALARSPGFIDIRGVIMYSALKRFKCSPLPTAGGGYVKYAASSAF